MKKLLLIVLALGIGFLTYAQQGNKFDAEIQTQDLSRAQFDVADPGTFSMMNPYKPVNNTVKGTAAIDKYQISSSANVYTLLVTQSHCLTADQPSGVMMFTHRADPSVGLGTSSADIVTSHSTDDGQTWSQNIVLQNANNNRYPSGVIFNPLGAVSIDSLMAVWNGPVWHGPAGGEVWDENYYGNSTFNGFIKNSQYIANPVGEEVLIRMGFSACDDGYVHVMGPNYEYNSSTQYMDYRNTVVMTGVFNMSTLSFDWTTSIVAANEFVTDPTSGDMVGSYNMQWSQDGNVGWIYYTARDNRNDQKAYQPIAYYTLDKGLTWTVVPFFDYGTIPTIFDNFWSLRADTARVVPTFYYWNDGVVDANGQLHIFVEGQGKYSIHDDSLNYSYTYEPDFLIDLHTTMTGWDAVLIDTVWTGVVSADESGYGTGTDAIGWTHRTQASRSQDGTKVFVVWSDTDTLFSDLNKFPDIKAWGMDVNTGVTTGSVNFTAGTIYAANNFFQYVSNISIKDGSKYTIPVSTADLGVDPADPVGHYYLSGIEFDFALVSVVDIANSPDLVVDVYPNPAKDVLNISTTENIKDIKIFSAFGRLVAEEIVGDSKVIINTSKLSPGMYFVQINTEVGIVSRKINIVE